jgi:8-oxo-dGTP pyrophosphatase MutT (NUDIX family)
LSDWPALRQAAAYDAAARVPFMLNDRQVGSVARTHLLALRDLDVPASDTEVALHATEATLARLNAALREQGLIVAWRDEPFPILDPTTGARLGTMERAAARFWGTLTLGAHANGYVADASGLPTHLWIAQRSLTKATDPGKHDNLIGGGVPDGQTPLQTLLREGWEEAGLQPEQMRGVIAGSVLRLQRDIPEGLQHEWLHVFDLQLPHGLEPDNQDGEVAGFACLPMDEALILAAGDTMTVDAALVTLDFALRRALIPPPRRQQLAALLDPRRVEPSFKDSEPPRQGR